MAYPRHIVIQRFSSMGDVAMTVPVILAMKKHYPEVELTLLTRPQYHGIFRRIPGLFLFPVDLEGRHQGLLGLKRLVGEVHKERPQAVADLHDVLRTHILNFFWKTKAVPVKSIDKGRKEKRRLVRQKEKSRSPLKTTHRRYLEVFEKMFFEVPWDDSYILEKEALSSELIGITGEKKIQWLGIAPFAQHQGKTYPLHQMEQVLNNLKDQPYKIFLLGGGQKEIGILSEWEKKFPYATSLAEKLPFEDQLKVISNLDLMLSMDSGNGHLAANYGVPVITIWGMTHPSLGFAPYGQAAENWIIPDLVKFPKIPSSTFGNVVPQGYQKAWETISPEEVVRKIREQLSS